MGASNKKGRAGSCPESCPHCKAGGNGVSQGLYWDFDGQCWRCVICGYRGFSQAARPPRHGPRFRVWV